MNPPSRSSGIPVPSTLGTAWGEGLTARAVAIHLSGAGQAFVTGEKLCRKLGVSRTAVWKAVGELKKEGYRIEAVRKLGYRLLKVPDAMLPAVVGAGLDTRKVGRHIACFRRASSTNAIAAYLAERGAPDGCVVAAETQWGGKGRFGRKWHSPSGGLWFSVVLRPELPASGAQVLTFLGAVAAANAVRKECRLPVALKWPNDLMLEGKKLGGVLTEISAETDLIRYAVIGVGLNVNLCLRDLPREMRAKTASLQEVLGAPVSRTALLRRILSEMDARYVALSEGDGREELMREWRGMTTMMGAIVRIEHLSRVREGTVSGVDDDGALLLRSASGSVERFLAGDVTVLR